MISKLIEWSNTNSGFVAVLGILFGSGILNKVIQFPSICDLRANTRQTYKQRIPRQKKAIKIFYLYLRFGYSFILKLSFLILVAILLIGSIYGENTNNKITNNNSNRVMFNSKAPIENRVLVPENSEYKDIDMVSTEPQINRTIDKWEEIATPFVSSEDDLSGMMDEIEFEVLKNPLFGDMIVTGFANLYHFESDLDFFDDIRTNNDYSWIEAFYNETQNAFKSDSGVAPIGLNRWVRLYTFSDGLTCTYVTDEYRIFAERICQSLRDLMCFGVMDVKPDVYYQRNNTASLNSLRAITHNLNDDSPPIRALVLSYSYNAFEEKRIIGFAIDNKGLVMYNEPGRG